MANPDPLDALREDYRTALRQLDQAREQHHRNQLMTGALSIAFLVTGNVGAAGAIDYVAGMSKDYFNARLDETERLIHYEYELRREAILDARQASQTTKTLDKRAKEIDDLRVDLSEADPRDKPAIQRELDEKKAELTADVKAEMKRTHGATEKEKDALRVKDEHEKAMRDAEKANNDDAQLSNEINRKQQEITALESKLGDAQAEEQLRAQKEELHKLKSKQAQVRGVAAFNREQLATRQANNHSAAAAALQAAAASVGGGIFAAVIKAILSAAASAQKAQENGKRAEAKKHSNDKNHEGTIENFNQGAATLEGEQKDEKANEGNDIQDKIDEMSDGT